MTYVQQESIHSNKARWIPPLCNGDHLTRNEFERRYEAMPGVNKAELIEGVVHMPSPVSAEEHGEPHFDLNGWLFVYRAHTPPVRGGDNSTLRLDLDNEPQPDGYLRLLPECGGQAKVIDGYVTGAPELIVEVAASSASYDLHEKLHAYRRNGVREYIVWRVWDEAIDWLVLRGGRYEPLPLVRRPLQERSLSRPLARSGRRARRRHGPRAGRSPAGPGLPRARRVSGRIPS